jgi:hypothetical protein
MTQHRDGGTQVPSELKRRVERSVGAVCSLSGGARVRCDADALATVPRKLRQEVLLHLHKDMVSLPPPAPVNKCHISGLSLRIATPCSHMGDVV